MLPLEKEALMLDQPVMEDDSSEFVFWYRCITSSGKWYGSQKDGKFAEFLSGIPKDGSALAYSS